MVVGTDCVSQYKSNKDTMKAKKALLMISNFFSFHGDIWLGGGMVLIYIFLWRLF